MLKIFIINGQKFSCLATIGTSYSSRKKYKMESICNPEYLALQNELFDMAKKASLWMRNYFLKSDDVVVSSPEYLDSLLETWTQNPCEGKEQ